MAVKLYTGIMGSGKTYEVVSEVILNSLRRGRRVVSNIAGLNYDLMREILLAEGILEDAIGDLVQVDHSKVLEPIFWPTDTDTKTGRKAFIQMGDVVCLDEIWRFWSGFSTKDEDGNKRPQEVMNFFRMHRQMPDPISGLTCEIALITQDVLDCSRQVRGVLEEIYVMTKLTALGLTTRYRVDIHSRKVGRKPLRSIQRTYDPRYFPLYASHSQKKSGGAAVHEENIDTRGNILKGGLFRFALPMAAVILMISIYALWRIFHPSAQEGIAPINNGDSAQTKIHQINRAPEHNTVEVLDQWRVIGHYNTESQMIVLIQSDNGSVRQLVNPPHFQFLGSGLSVELPEGGFATSWTKLGIKQGGIL